MFESDDIWLHIQDGIVLEWKRVARDVTPPPSESGWHKLRYSHEFLHFGMAWERSVLMRKPCKVIIQDDGRFFFLRIKRKYRKIRQK